MNLKQMICRNALAIALAVAVLWAHTSAGAAEPRSLKVISYNVQFLPGLAAVANKRKQPLYRAEQLGKQLAAFDIVCLQEVFEPKPRKTLLAGIEAAWGSDYQGIELRQPTDGRFMGGLAIAARLPFLETNETTFTAFSDPKKYGIGADGFAAKGVLHARIAATKDAGSWIDVFVTHLEARADELRPQQYRELAEFVRAHSSPGQPVIIAGDMNTRGSAEDVAHSESDYRLMLSTYQKGRGDAPLIDAWLAAGQGPPGTTDQENSVDGGKRIDYIFFSNPSAGAARLSAKTVTVNRFLNPKVGALSDHSAVEGLFDWTP